MQKENLKELEERAKSTTPKDMVEKVEQAIRKLRLQREVTHEELYRTVNMPPTTLPAVDLGIVRFDPVADPSGLPTLRATVPGLKVEVLVRAHRPVVWCVAINRVPVQAIWRDCESACRAALAHLMLHVLSERWWASQASDSESIGTDLACTKWLDALDSRLRTGEEGC